MALLVGWTLNLVLRHQVMLWTWIIPLAVLLVSVFAYPTGFVPGIQLVPKLESTPWSLYFGRGCVLSSSSVLVPRDQYACIEASVITLPFYTSVAYSLGSLLARKALKRPSAARLTIWSSSICGVLLLAAVVEPVAAALVYAARGIDILGALGYRQLTADQRAFVIGFLILVTLFPSLLGGYLVRCAFKVRHESQPPPAPIAQEEFV